MPCTSRQEWKSESPDALGFCLQALVALGIQVECNGRPSCDIQPVREDPVPLEHVASVKQSNIQSDSSTRLLQNLFYSSHHVITIKNVEKPLLTLLAKSQHNQHLLLYLFPHLLLQHLACQSQISDARNRWKLGYADVFTLTPHPPLAVHLAA